MKDELISKVYVAKEKISELENRSKKLPKLKCMEEKYFKKHRKHEK